MITESVDMKGGVSREEFVSKYPLLYHMAWAGNWPSIQQHGLLSTSALLAMYEVSAQQRVLLEDSHRPKPVRLEHPVHGEILVRDQHPMSDKALRRVLLDGLTPRDWYRTLNSKVFFWVSEARLNRMLETPWYRHEDNLVMVLDSDALTQRYWDKVWLAPMNTGCTVPYAHPRGARTFASPNNYPWLGRKGRGEDRVVEFTVSDSVPDALQFVIRVEQREARSRNKPQLSLLDK